MPKVVSGKRRQKSIASTKSQIDNKTALPAMRTRAFLVDTFMISMPIAYLVIYLIMGGGSGFEHNKTMGWFIIVVLHAPIILLLWTLKGQTPGMKAYELEIKRISSDLRPSSLQLLIRYVATPISILSIVGVLIATWRKDKLTLQDILSGTQLINVKAK